MLRRVDTSAHLNRWRDKTGPVALLCCGLMLCAMLLPPWPGAALVLGVAVFAAVIGAHVPARLLARALAVPLGFLATSGLVLCVSLSWGNGGLHWAFAPAGAASATTAGARALAAVSVTLLFALTIPLPQQLELLRRLRLPEALLDLMLLTYRTLFLLEDCRTEILQAQRNRLGYRTARLALHSSGLAAHALFVRAMDRAARLERGMAARGYSGRLTVLTPPQQTRYRDYFFALTLPLLVALSVVLLRESL